MLFLNELKNLVDAQVIITYEGGRVVGFIQSELTIYGGNDFVNPLNASALESAQSVIRGAGMGIELFAKYLPFIKKIFRNVNYSFQFAQQTTDDWMGSDKPVFSIDLTFIAENESDDIRAKTSLLYKTVYPELRLKFATKKIQEVQVLTAPLGYKVSAAATAIRGTIAVQIGRWFRAAEQVMRKVNFSFSKEVIKNGTPLYATGRIEFAPFKQPDVETFLGYFLRKK